ncbi:uncharacterized protein [Amphiura filiformis]|uniref:uncharacterized protein isoform X5 n=1 Tax=Amphiura filiformis TaxID=82378 RepID=UPI003B218EA4
MALVLNFCDSCADKRVREVKPELEQLFKKKKLNRRKCGICCGEIKLKKEPVERIEKQEEFCPSDNVEVNKTESNELVEEIANVPKDVSVSRDDSDEDLEMVQDTDFIPSDVSDDDQSDAGSNYSDENKLKSSQSKSIKKKDKTMEAAVKCRSRLEINDVNLEVKEMILEGSITSKQFACKKSKKKFKWKATMMKKFSVHLSEHMEQKEVLKPFKCTLCTSCFSHFATLKKHTRAHNNPLYDCPHPDCDHKFMYKKARSKHEELVHSGLAKEHKAKLGVAKEHKSYVCQICGLVLKTARSLENHLLRHEGLKAFKCSECDKCFIDKKSLTRHKVVHADAKNVICEVCGKAFFLLEQLKKHCIVHSERAYQCEYCSYRAKRLKDLKAHTRKIHVESSLKCTCDVCGLTFLSAPACTKHKKKHQCGSDLAEALLKPYKCPDCGYRAKKPSAIPVHRRSHTGEKPFKCAHCQRAFTQRGQCTKHMKICKKK